MRLLDLATLLQALGIVFMMVPLGAAANASPLPLDGLWAGDRLRLTVFSTGANLELECADGTIHGAIKPDIDGNFTAVGTLTSRGPGPQWADAPAAPAARFAGTVTTEVMTLSIWPHGVEQPLTFRLQKGAQIKMIRCF